MVIVERKEYPPMSDRRQWSEQDTVCIVDGVGYMFNEGGYNCTSFNIAELLQALDKLGK